MPFCGGLVLLVSDSKILAPRVCAPFQNFIFFFGEKITFFLQAAPPLAWIKLCRGMYDTEKVIPFCWKLILLVSDSAIFLFFQPPSPSPRCFCFFSIFLCHCILSLNSPHALQLFILSFPEKKSERERICAVWCLLFAA